MCPRQDGKQKGNPILPATAEKFESEIDLVVPAPDGIEFRRIYRSGRVGGAVGSASSITYSASSGSSSGSGSASGSFYAETSSRSSIGKGWSINLGAKLTLIQSVITGASPGNLGWAIIEMGDGRHRSFVPTGIETWRPAGTNQDKLYTSTPGQFRTLGSEFIFQPADSDEKFVFRLAPNQMISVDRTNTAYLHKKISNNGRITTFNYAYSNTPEEARLVTAVNEFGQRIELTYNADNLVQQVRHINPAEQTVRSVEYAYENENLVRVTYPDGTVLINHYENSNNPSWLTGQSLGEARIGTYHYDGVGKALETTRAGGAGRYTFEYINTNNTIYTYTKVTDPLGTSRNYGFSAHEHRLNVHSASAHSEDVADEPVRTRSFNSLGLATSESAFRGYSWRVTTYDLPRELPLSITEGISARTQTITWHPTLRLPTQIDETGGKRTMFAYDDKGNLLQKTITATTGTPVNETWTWTYNAQGLMASETDPRGATTTYAYNTWGQLTSQTNALGHVTSYAHNSAGLVSQINEPTGLVRYLTYTPRGWLATSTLSAGGVNLATAYTYTVDGQVKSVALPNGHTITYSYDAALRNTGWSDNRGQSASYTLDPAGNATDEQVKNNGGQLALQIRRTISALNRVQSETRGAGIVETYTQDANGRLASVTDATSKTTTYGRDALERINSVTNATSRTATVTYNAQDAVTKVVDFQYVTTNYTRDVQGNARSEATPDAGTTASTYDALGLPSRIVDAIARATDITRDALGRPTLITHTPATGTSAATAGGKTLTTQLRYDLSGTACNASGQANASKGRLCEVIDMSNGVTQATTQYQWDAFGRLTRQTQTLSSAIANHSHTRTTAFTYLVSGGGKGELATLTYPSGTVLTHQYNAAGRLSGMLWGGQPLLQNITYNALDQPLSWTWAFGDANTATSLNATRLYNTAGQLTSSEFASFAPESTGRIGSVTQKLLRSNGAGGWLEEEVPFNALYNSLGQLTSFTAVGISPVFQWGHTYSYDNNANRTGGSITANGASMAFTSGVQSGTNRQSNAAGITVTTNAAGDITSLLGKTLAYDSAGQLAEATAVPPCPSGSSCVGLQTTLSRFNGWGQRYLRDTPQMQTVFSYGSDGHNLLAETTRYLSTSALSTTEHIWLPTASGPMPVAAVIDGVHYAVHADHLNTPRRLSDATGQTRWQWPYSGFGEIAPQSTPAAGQAPLNYGMRYPGQIDDGNGLFYNWHRFYDPRVGRYTKADPIGLEGGWNRFGYVGGESA